MAPASVGTQPSGGGSSFFSFLQQGSNDLSSDPGSGPDEESAGQSSYKRNADSVNAALMSLNMQPVAPAANPPLPLKLSLNLFGPRSEAAKSDSQKSETKGTKQGEGNQSAIPLVWTLASQNPDAAAAKAGSAGDAENGKDANAPANQGDSDLNMDAGRAPAAQSSQLAFALRLTHNEDQTNANNQTKPHNPSAPAAVAAEAAHEQKASSGSADSDADNRHAAGSDSDADLSADAAAPVLADAGGLSFSAAHVAVAPEQTPSPAPLTTDAPAAAPQSPAPTAVVAHPEPPAKIGSANELSFSVSATISRRLKCA